MGSLELRSESADIPHYQGIRSNTIQGFLVPGPLPLRERMHRDHRAPIGLAPS